jgi:regulatory protein
VPQKSTTRHETAAKQRPCLAHALRLLTRRALSDQTLQAELAEAAYAPEDIEAAMVQIRAWGYINDERLGESVVAAAVRQKKGPAWLRQQLGKRRVPHDIASRCADALTNDAQALAQDVLLRRFGAAKLADARTALRAMRLLQRRGFDGSTIRQALQAVRQNSPASDEFLHLDEP